MSTLVGHLDRIGASLKRRFTYDERTSDWLFTLVIALLALLPRLYVALAWAKEPVWDGHYYHFGATRIAEGLGYSEDVIRNGLRVWKPWTHYPVGYSAFLAIFYKLLGPHNWVAPVVNSVAGASLVALMHRLVKLGLGTWRARFAATITAVHPGLIAYSTVVMTEPLAALLLVLAVVLIVRAPEKNLTLLWASVTLAAAVLVRPNNATCGAAPLRPISVFLLAFRRAHGGHRRCLSALRFALDRAQLLPHGRLRARVDQCRMEPRNWRFDGHWPLSHAARR